MTLPTPHGDKLQALLRNNKLPDGDRKRIEKATAWQQAGEVEHLDTGERAGGVTGGYHMQPFAIAGNAPQTRMIRAVSSP